VETVQEPALVIRIRGAACSVRYNGDSLLDGSGGPVHELFRKLVENTGVTLSYDEIERQVFGAEPRGSQGAASTKNAVSGLRAALFGNENRARSLKWTEELKEGGKTLLRLEKPHVGRICLTLPLPHDDPDVLLDLDRHVEAGTPSSSTAPFTVRRPRSRHFYGRDDLISRLHELLIVPAGPAIALCGSGGMGKSQVASEYAHIHRESYPGGVYWIDARDARSVQDEYLLLSRDTPELRTPQDLPPDERVQRVRRSLSNLTCPALLILDSLGADAALLDLLPVVGACRILATTRIHALPKLVFYTIELEDLDEQAAVAVLQSCCGIEETAHRVAARERACTIDQARQRERMAVSGIVGDLNRRLPLALILISSYVDQRRSTFEECRRRLAANSLEVYRRSELPYSIDSAFRITSDTLTPEGLRVIATAACFARRDISPTLLQSASGIADQDTFEDALAELDRGSFLSIDLNGRVTLHDLIRDMTLDQTDPTERDALLRRVAETLIACIEEANAAMVWDGVSAELRQASAVAELCRRHGLLRTLATLLSELGHAFAQQGDGATASEFHEEAVLTVEVSLPHERSLLARCKARLSAANPGSRSGLRAARQALALARDGAAPSDLTLAEHHNLVGLALKMNGRPKRALPFYCRALALCEASEGRASLTAAEYLNNLGALYESLGEYQLAENLLAESLSTLERVCSPGHRKVAIALNNLGRVQLKLGDARRALLNHQRARDLYESLYGSETKHFAMSRFFAAAALAKLGRIAQAMTEARGALQVLELKYGGEDPLACRVRAAVQSGSF
jgi:tetratricopeptide (TPR) repeat protein